MTIETVVERAAGLDIAKASLVACVRVPTPDGGWRVHKRKFATMSADLGSLANWLAEHRVTRVGMESTSDYWRPVFYLLEDRFECWLLNARHMRAVPGRKTDMTDAKWICDLVAHGLVRPSFVPPPPIRRLRDLTRRRAILPAGRPQPREAADGEAARRRRREAVGDGHRHLQHLRPGDARRANRRRTRPAGAGRPGPGPAAGQDSRSGRGAGRTLRRAPRLPRRIILTH